MATLKDRDRLAALADDAITNGSRTAFNQLQQTSDDNSNPLTALAASLVLQVKSFYLHGSRIAGYKLVIDRFSQLDAADNGALTSSATHSNDDLIYELQHAQDWQARAKSAQLLKDRKSQAVVKALFEIIKRESHLEVVRDAVNSFNSLTGCPIEDVFGLTIPAWWDVNKAGILASMPPK